MLARKKISTQKTIIMVSIIAVIWIVIGTLFYYNFGDTKKNNNTQAYSKLIDFGKDDSKIKDGANSWPSGVEVLNDVRYTRLKAYGDIPISVDPKDKGRSNPFEPIPSQPLPTPTKK